MKKVIKNIIEWGIAGVLALLIINVIVVPYFHFAPWIDIPGNKNATEGMFLPSSVISYGMEGFSVRTVDTNGYVNDSVPDENEPYVLVMGASHTVAKEIPKGQSFCDILKNQYGYPVYSIAMDGHHFPGIISGFKAATEQFDNASCIVIELAELDFTADELEEALQQRKYDSAYAGNNILNTMSDKQKLKLMFQNYFPAIRLIKRNFSDESGAGVVAKSDNGGNASDERNTGCSKEEYAELVNRTISLIRSEYDKRIIVVYHPTIYYDEAGIMKCTESDSLEGFIKACEVNEIEFINLSDDFYEAYEDDYSVPYGFINTSIGSGHLNKKGHRIIADKLAEVL